MNVIIPAILYWLHGDVHFQANKMAMNPEVISHQSDFDFSCFRQNKCSYYCNEYF